MNLSSNPYDIEEHLSLLLKLDNETKKKLIVRLTESLEVVHHNETTVAELFGTWEDERSSEEIIEDIRTSRMEKNEFKRF